MEYTCRISVVLFFLFKLSNESDEESYSYTDEERFDESNEHDTVIRHMIYINQNTTLLTTRTTTDDNDVIVDMITNHGNRQTTYLNKKKKTTFVLPSANNGVCLLYTANHLQQSLAYQFSQSAIIPQTLVASKVQKCVYAVTSLITEKDGKIGQFCGNRQVYNLKLLHCGNISPQGVKLSTRRQRKKRSSCLQVWETYRVETTCLTTLIYHILQRTCVTQNEYFSKYLCLVDLPAVSEY